jgi:chitodextrinase
MVLCQKLSRVKLHYKAVFMMALRLSGATAAIACGMAGCGTSPGSIANPTTVGSISITPGDVVVSTGAHQQFVATTSSQESIRWMVDGLVGGSVSAGTITPTGLYTAPGIDPGRNVVIQAVSPSNSSVNARATVTVAKV